MTGWWIRFTDSFENKGTQILMLWVTDLLVLAALVFLWKHIDSSLQTIIVGIVSAVNGAWLNNLGADSKKRADTLVASFAPVQPPTEKKP